MAFAHRLAPEPQLREAPRGLSFPSWGVGTTEAGVGGTIAGLSVIPVYPGHGIPEARTPGCSGRRGSQSAAPRGHPGPSEVTQTHWMSVCLGAHLAQDLDGPSH